MYSTCFCGLSVHSLQETRSPGCKTFFRVFSCRPSVCYFAGFGTCMVGQPHVGQYLGSTLLSSTHLYPHFKHTHSGKTFSPRLSLECLLLTFKHLNLYLRSITRPSFFFFRLRPALLAAIKPTFLPGGACRETVVIFCAPLLLLP